MKNYKFSIPLGAKVHVSGTTTHGTFDAIDQLREAVSASGGSASISMGDPADCDVSVPPNGEVKFKLMAVELIEKFGLS